MMQFDDGLPTPLEIGGDAACERALETSMEAVEPGSYAAYSAYLTSARANLASGLPIFIKEQFDLESLATLPSFLRSALLGGGADGGTLSPLRDWPLRTHGGQLAELFAAPRHRELGGFQVGNSPFCLPAACPHACRPPAADRYALPANDSGSFLRVFSAAVALGLVRRPTTRRRGRRLLAAAGVV